MLLARVIAGVRPWRGRARSRVLGVAGVSVVLALGLFAAIPAVVAYNKFSTDFGRYAGRLDGFSTEFSAILSRQLDEKA